MIDLQTSPDGRGELTFDSAGVAPDVLADKAREVLRQAFASGSARQITWRAAVGDAVARRTAWLLGMTFEGINRSGWAREDGTLVDAWTGTLVAGDSLEPSGRWLEPVRLEGERVLLRPLMPHDEERYLATTNDPESMLWLADVPLARDSEAFRQRLERLSAWPSLGTAVEWVIAEPQTDELIGSVNLFDFDGLDHKSAEVGYRTHPDARGRGLLKEALRMLITYAFTPEDEGGLGLERIHLGAGDGNAASQAVARGLGFTETGRDRRCYRLPDGAVVDLVRFDLLASEWRG